MSWKQRVYLIGIVVGVLVGLGAARLYVRAVEDSGAEAPPKVKTSDLLKVTFNLFGLLRQVASLAE